MTDSGRVCERRDHPADQKAVCPHGLGKTTRSIDCPGEADCRACPCFLSKQSTSVLCTGPSGIVDRKSLKDAIDGRSVPTPDFVRHVLGQRHDEQVRRERILARLSQEETRIGNTGYFRRVPPSLEWSIFLIAKRSWLVGFARASPAAVQQSGTQVLTGMKGRLSSSAPAILSIAHSSGTRCSRARGRLPSGGMESPFAFAIRDFAQEVRQEREW